MSEHEHHPCDGCIQEGHELADARAEVERLRRELDEARSIRDHYVRQYALAKDILEDANDERDRLGATAALLREALEGLSERVDYPRGDFVIHGGVEHRLGSECPVCAALAADPDEWLKAHDAEVARNVRSECHGGLCLTCIAIQSEQGEALVEPYGAMLADLIGGVPHERRNEKRCNTCGQGWPCDNERARALLGAPQDGAR